MNDQRDDKSDSDDVCLICCEPIRFYAVGPCNHRNICSLCSVRRRSLYDQYDCCLCKQDLEQVVFTLDRSQPFSAFNIGLLTTQPTLPGVYFADQVIVDEISNLFSLRCPICSDQSFTNLFALKEHVKKHQLHYCSLCLTHKKVFLNEQTLFTRTDLQLHLQPGKRGKAPNGEKEPQHQWCHFCKKRFYDKDHLYNHLHEKHEKCHVCEKQGTPNQYFADYQDLEKHFDKDHHLCHDASCLEKKFVVFTTALDLQAHEIAVHVAARKMSKAEKREASKLNIGLVFSSASSSSGSAPPPPASAPAPPTSTATHRHTNEPLVNFAAHQQMAESWNFPSLPGSGKEEHSKRPVVLGRNEWNTKETAPASEAWPTLPSSKSSRRRASPPSPPPELPGYGGYYGGRDYRGKMTSRWGI